MVKNKHITISTKKGDSGQSFLASGEKLAKTDLVFEVLGCSDELNSHIGLVVAKLKQTDVLSKEEIEYLEKIQHTLFYIGAELAGSSKAKLETSLLTELEETADKMQVSMSDNWTTKFTLPGGTELGAYIDVARTVCRRCEVLVFKLDQTKQVSSNVKKYMNRLSDFLYILRCKVNEVQNFEEKFFESKKPSFISCFRS